GGAGGRPAAGRARAARCPGTPSPARRRPLDREAPRPPRPASTALVAARAAGSFPGVRTSSSCNDLREQLESESGLVVGERERRGEPDRRLAGAAGPEPPPERRGGEGRPPAGAPRRPPEPPSADAAQRRAPRR